MSSFTNTSAGTDSLDGSTGFWNTAYGAYTLSGANNGKNNVAVGGNAMLINSEGSYNTAVGTAAMTFNTTGNLNIAMGNNAMCGNTTGDQNTAIGVQSLSVSNVYNNNTALGYHSASNISAGNNTAIGSETLYNSVASSGNTALGYRAGYFAVTGEGNNTYLGINTGQASGDGGIYSNSTAIGSGATIDDSHQITIGTSAEYIRLSGRVEQALNTTNCQFGTGALKNSTTTAASCTAIGVNAAKALTDANDTTAIGTNALLNYTVSGSGFPFGNTAVGSAAMYNTSTGGGNTAVGISSLLTNTTGYSNVGVGLFSLYKNNSGSNNTCIGQSSGYNITSGYQNIAIGNNSMSGVDVGAFNVAVGNTTLNSGNTNSCAALGFDAGRNDYGGAGNTYLGYNAGPASSAASPLPVFNNSTAIGSNSVITASNQIVLGRTSSTVTIPGRLEQGWANGNMQYGFGSMEEPVTGSNNTAIGVYAAQILTGSSDTTAIGQGALEKATSGASGCTAIGRAALFFNNGVSNTAVGYNAMWQNTTGYYNVAVGTNAFGSMTTGENSVAVGYNAAPKVTTGTVNIAIGEDAMEGVIGGNYNVAVGSTTLNINDTSASTALGHFAGMYNGGGTDNTYLGYQTGQLASDTNVYSTVTAIGAGAVTTASHQIMMGTALEAVIIPGRLEQGWANGNMQYGFGSMEEPVTGSNNTAIGVYAAQILTGSSDTTAIGQGALEKATSGASGCTAIGRAALFFNNGVSNTAVGYNAMWQNTTGYYNVAVGTNAFGSMTTGENSVAVGYNAAPKVTTGTVNIAIGEDAMEGVIGGNYNVAVGSTTLNINDTSASTALGHFAGMYNGGGTDNTYLGYQTGQLASDTNVYSTVTAIGAGAVTTASHQIMLGTVNETTEIPGKLEVTGYPVTAQPAYINMGIAGTSLIVPNSIANDSIFLISSVASATLPSSNLRPGLKLTFVSSGIGSTITTVGGDLIASNLFLAGGTVLTLNADRDSVTIQSIASGWQVVANTSTTYTIT